MKKIVKVLALGALAVASAVMLASCGDNEQKLRVSGLRVIPGRYGYICPYYYTEYDANKENRSDLIYTLDSEKLLNTIKEDWGIELSEDKVYVLNGSDRDDRTEIANGTKVTMDKFLYVSATTGPEVSWMRFVDKDGIEFPSGEYRSRCVPVKYRSGRFLNAVREELATYDISIAGVSASGEFAKEEAITLEEGVTNLSDYDYIKVQVNESHQELGNVWIYVLFYNDIETYESQLADETAGKRVGLYPKTYYQYEQDSEKSVSASEIQKFCEKRMEKSATGLYKVAFDRSAFRYGEATALSSSDTVEPYSYVICLMNFAD